MIRHSRAMCPRSESARRPSPFQTAFGPLEDRVVPTFGASGLLAPAAAASTPIASAGIGSQIVGLDASQSASARLATADVNLGGLLGNIRTQLGSASPSDALTANVTLGQLMFAAGVAAQADGNPTGPKLDQTFDPFGQVMPGGVFIG